MPIALGYSLLGPAIIVVTLSMARLLLSWWLGRRQDAVERQQERASEAVAPA